MGTQLFFEMNENKEILLRLCFVLKIIGSLVKRVLVQSLSQPLSDRDISGHCFTLRSLLYPQKIFTLVTAEDGVKNSELVIGIDVMMK